MTMFFVGMLTMVFLPLLDQFAEWLSIKIFGKGRFDD